MYFNVAQYIGVEDNFDWIYEVGQIIVSNMSYGFS